MFRAKQSGAWSIDYRDFQRCTNEKERFFFFLQYGILAPSGHNSQPWRFELRNNGVDCWVVCERSLIQSDPGRRQLYLSFGCMIENVVIAADFFGYDTKVSLSSNFSFESAFITLSFSARTEKKQIPYESHLISAIPSRYSNRFPYQDRSVPEIFFEKLNAAAAIRDSNFLVRKVISSDERALLADCIVEAGVVAMDSASFRQELSEFLISNISKRRLGMPGFALGIPLIPSLAIQQLVRSVNVSKLSKKKDWQTIEAYTPALVVITTAHDTHFDRFQAGRLAEHGLLLATNHGLVSSIFAAPVQDECYAIQIQKTLQIPGRIQFIFRVGFPTTQPLHTPRLSLNECLISSYGS